MHRELTLFNKISCFRKNVIVSEKQGFVKLPLAGISNGQENIASVSVYSKMASLKVIYNFTS